MFNFLQDLVVVANCLPHIACLWTPLPPTINESSAIKDIKQKLPSSQYVRPSFQKIISYPTLAFGQETSMNLSVFHEQRDLGYHICWKAPSIGYHICIYFSTKHPFQPVECWISPPRSMFEFLGHHQPDATDEAVAQSCAHWVKIDALSNSWDISHLKAVWTPKGVEGERKTRLSKLGTPHIPWK